MLIKVTRNHISRGKQNSCTECPIALALQEHLSDDTIVDDNYIIIRGRKYLHTSVTAKFINDWAVDTSLIEPIEIDTSELRHAC